MARKEALKDLQIRLAERLKQARSEGISAAWLAVQVGPGNYLFPLAQAGEIFPLAPMSWVPYVRPWFMGVVNLRGGLFGVVDLGGFMARTESVIRTEPGAQARLVTFNADLEVNSALLVDALIGLRRKDAFVRALPAHEDAPNYFGQQLVDTEGVSWQEINMQTLAKDPEFLIIGA